MSDNANGTIARARGDWDAAAFFERLTGANRLAREMGFRFCRVSGLQGQPSKIKVSRPNNSDCLRL